MSDQVDPKLQTIIAKVDSNISEFRREAHAVKRYDKALAAEMESLGRDYIETFANNLKIAVTAGPEASVPLVSLCTRIETDRSRYLLQFLQDAIPKIRRKLISPFWLGSQLNVLTELDGTEREIDSASLQRMSRQDRLGLLKDSFQKLEEVVRQLEQDRQVSKRRTPVKTLLWGVPIWLGIILSGRFGLWGNSLSFLFLVGAVVVSFVLASRKTLASLSGRARSGKVVKGPFLKLAKDRAFIFISLLVGIASMIAVLFQSRKDAATFLTRDPAVISAENRIEGKPGEEVHPKVIISSPNQPIYAVRLEIDSPLLERQQSVEAKVISTSAVPMPISLQIIKDAPLGSFPATLTISYSTTSTSLLYSGFVTKSRQTQVELRVRE